VAAGIIGNHSVRNAMMAQAALMLSGSGAFALQTGAKLAPTKD